MGGVAQTGNWKEEVDAEDSEDIWNRAVALFPFIKVTHSGVNITLSACNGLAKPNQFANFS